MGDYHNLYVQLDTMLLADTFQRFRKKCHKTYDLDPVHFYFATRLNLIASFWTFWAFFGNWH